MPRYKPDPRKHPVKSSGEGWLFSEQQQLVCYFKADTPTVNARWVAVRTYSWISPRTPVPQTRRRMIRPKGFRALQIIHSQLILINQRILDYALISGAKKSKLEISGTDPEKSSFQPFTQSVLPSAGLSWSPK